MTTRTKAGSAARSGIIERWRSHLPVSDATPVVSLGEGGTPLIFSERLSSATGAEVWLKYEGLNPTGSFKDRGMTVAISKAVEEGSAAVVCASTGNTSASAAAYAARAGLPCGVLIPRGKVALGKIAQSLVHGARVLEVDGNFDHALELTKQLAAAHPITLVNSVNPFRIEGQKTGAFEIVESMGGAPDLHLMPVGNAGNITAYWRGYREAVDAGWSRALPQMFGWQAEGASPIVTGQVVAQPETVATAIRIGNPASWAGAVEAADSSGGAIRAVSDEEIIDSYEALAREGIFVELASAAGVAGLKKMSAAGQVPAGARVVCVLTGHGLKDPDWVIAATPRPPLVGPDVEEILKQLELT
ncbi:MAG: threonine synthase [Actinomycetota bacterium]|nr:threonine synthase [Actinomycetota bacterium]